jgi:RNA polymerase sigma-70 factor, ECF subfamily
MMCSTSHVLAAALEEVLWSHAAEPLAAAQSVLRALLSAAGCDLPEVLAEMADETLVLAVQKGFLRQQAFEECLVNRYEPALLVWSFRRTGNLERAQDLVQELYVKLLTQSVLDTYKPSCLFRPWLWRVVHNLWISEVRRQHKTEGLPDEEPPAYGPLPPEEAAFNELEHRVEAIVRELPGAQQQVLREAMHGSDADAIAQKLGIAKPKVFRLLFKTRRHVERILGLDTGGTTRRMDAPREARHPLEGIP